MVWAASAVAAGASTHVGLSGASVLAHGGAADARITYVCPPRYGGSRGYAIVNIEITQSLARGDVDGLDTGGDPDVLRCDGTAHTTRIVVLPLPAGTGPARSFQAGRPATVTASVLACDAAEEHCIQPTFSQNTQLDRAQANDPANTPADAEATLLPDGSVRLQVDQGCPTGATGFLSVAGASERLRHGLAAISAFQAATNCTHQWMRTTFHPSELAFTTGLAYLVATWSVCRTSRCVDGSATGTLPIAP